ncbi:hypothetical protein ACLOJK_018794, partial [Asimina triloba]
MSTEESIERSKGSQPSAGGAFIPAGGVELQQLTVGKSGQAGRTAPCRRYEGRRDHGGGLQAPGWHPPHHGVPQPTGGSSNCLPELQPSIDRGRQPTSTKSTPHATPQYLENGVMGSPHHLARGCSSNSQLACDSR